MITKSQTGKIDDFFSEILTHTTVGLIEKGLLFPGKVLVWGCSLPYVEVKWICTNDHSPDACIIPTLLNKFLWLKLQQVFSEKIAFI